jgi:hypothetical protein
MEGQALSPIGNRACLPAMSFTWHTVRDPALGTVIPLMRVTANIPRGVHIALTAGQHATQQVGESPTDGTITANPRTPEAPSDTGH